MGLDMIFFIAFLVFLMALIFFIFRKPKKIKRWEAILICLIGVVGYGSLFGAICYDEFNMNTVATGNIQETENNSNKNTNNKSIKDEEKNSNNKNGKIIGNTDSKIYHVPGSTYYEKELKKESNNEYFDTVEEAEKAGYRAPKR